MLIGIYDLDMLIYQKFYPSLDLMKYSSYHKSRGDIVKMIYDEENWEVFNLIYVRRDRYSRPPPAHITANPKVVWVGKKFLDGVPIQLPDEVENCIPDRSIYHQWFHINYSKFNPDRRSLFNRILYEGMPYRFTFGGELVADGYKVKGQDKVCLYDVDAFITREIFKPMLNNPTAHFHFIEPQKIYNLNDWLFLRDNFTVYKRNNNIIYVGNISDKEYKEYYRYFHNQFQMILPQIRDDSEVLPQFKRYFNRIMYSISKGTTIYYAYNENSIVTEHSKLVNFLKPLSKNLGFKSNFCALDFLQKNNKTLYIKLTTDPEWKSIYDELYPYLSQNIFEIYRKGEWNLYDVN